MSDVSPDDGARIFRLIYRSHSLVPSEQRTGGLGEIFATARRHNRALGITGALVVTQDAFVQTLEGDEDAVRRLFETICQDERHDHITLLEERTAPRTFGRWSMARVSEDGGPDIRLLSNAGRREIVSAPRDPSITEAQEAVLGYMRDAATEETLGSEASS